MLIIFLGEEKEKKFGEKVKRIGNTSGTQIRRKEGELKQNRGKEPM